MYYGIYWNSFIFLYLTISQVSIFSFRGVCVKCALVFVILIQTTEFSYKWIPLPHYCCWWIGLWQHLSIKTHSVFSGGEADMRDLVNFKKNLMKKGLLNFPWFVSALEYTLYHIKWPHLFLWPVSIVTKCYFLCA